MARAVAASAAFDVLTLAQVRRADAVRAVLRGWVEGLRAVRRERHARRPDERRAAARRLVGVREAVAQQVDWTRVSPEAALTCPACGGGLPDAPAIHGRNRLHGVPG